jgi:hypothetical protein
MDTLDYNVKGVKSFRGMEGYGFNATLYRGKVKIAFVMDEANDGCYHYEWFNRAEDKILRDYCESLPKEAVCDMEIAVDPDMLMSALVDKYENDKKFSRLCKNSTVFRLKGDPEDGYQVYKKVPFNEAMKKLLVEKYGDTIEEILNEKYGG